MATVLDAFALVALALDEPAAAEVEALIRRGGAAVSAVNLAETIDQLVRVRSYALGDVRASFAPVLSEHVAVLDATEQVAWRAAEIRARHYHRDRCPLSLADCVALASVSSSGELATADPALARVARGAGVSLIALPDSSGRRP